MSNDQIDPEETPDGPERTLPRTESHVTDLATSFTMAHTSDRLFVIDFHRPEFRGVYDESGTNLGAAQISVATLTVPPIAAKRLHHIIGTQLERYEDRFGEIEIEEGDE